MPQFDLGLFIPQIFWLILCFTCLYAFTVGYSVPRLKKVYDERWQHTEKVRIDSLHLHRKAQEVIHAYEQALEQSRQEASILIRKSMQEISQETTNHKNLVIADVKKKLRNAELTLAEKKIQILLDSKSLMKELSDEIVQKVLSQGFAKET
jgi:F-type H+-transporting ATPase subunit b